MKYLLIIFCFAFATETNRTLFIGDSLSAYPTGWQDQLCEAKGWTKTNLAKSGKRTDWMLCQITDHLISDRKYDRIVIYGGINDVYTNVNIDSTVRTIQKIVDLANKYKIKPFVIVGYDGQVANNNTWIKDKKLEKKIKENYINYQNRLSGEIKNATIIPIIPIEKQDLFDGIHLSAQGHKTYVKYLTKFIF
jgi:lysophospholipase L1-like esterase